MIIFDNETAVYSTYSLKNQRHVRLLKSFLKNISYTSQRITTRFVETVANRLNDEMFMQKIESFPIKNGEKARILIYRTLSHPTNAVNQRT